MSRSHRATYPMLTAKKRIVSATKMKSDTFYPAFLNAGT